MPLITIKTGKPAKDIGHGLTKIGDFVFPTKNIIKATSDFEYTIRYSL